MTSLRLYFASPVSVQGGPPETGRASDGKINGPEVPAPLSCAGDVMRTRRFLLLLALIALFPIGLALAHWLTAPAPAPEVEALWGQRQELELRDELIPPPVPGDGLQGNPLPASGLGVLLEPTCDRFIQKPT